MDKYIKCLSKSYMILNPDWIKRNYPDTFKIIVHLEKQPREVKVHCSKCGKGVSGIDPTLKGNQLVVRAWVECPECIEKEQPNKSKLEKARGILEEYRTKNYHCGYVEGIISGCKCKENLEQALQQLTPLFEPRERRRDE